jgi:hypothetical protein
MLAKNVREDYRDKIAAAPAEAGIYRLMAAQCSDPDRADMYLKTAEGTLREAARCKKLLAKN